MQKNITILGGGIMGLMTAYTLADQYDITIYDPKGFPADNASLMAGGMLAPYSEIEHMDISWVKAGLKSIDIWKDMRFNTGIDQNGSLLIAHNEDRHILERFKAHLPNNLQTLQDAQTLEPALDNKFKTGIFLEQEAHLDPTQIMQKLCDILKDKVTSITASTTPKECTNADIIIDCRGIETNDPDLRGVKGETLTVRNPEFALSRPVRLMHPRYPLYIIPREDNIFMIGATIIESSDNETVSLRSSMELMSALYALHPSFADAEIIDIKAGIRPSYPDNLPRITVKENIIICNGMFRHGHLLAPVMASCVKDYLQGNENEFLPLLLKGDSDDKSTKSHNQRAA